MALFGDNNQDLTITVKAKDEASSKLGVFQASLGKLTGAVALGTVAADAITKGMRTMAGVVSGSITAWNQQEKAMAQTRAVLTSTGHAAGMSAEELFKLSESLQATTTYGDEAILGAQNLLLTFTSIGKDIFPAATQTVLDMSTALGQDLKSSAIQLGKALQDPVLGVTALRRVGVNFNDAQQEVIATLVKTGQTAEAQRLIMAELSREFGGSATAAAKTFQGQMEQVKNKVGDVQETIGRGLTGALNSALVAFNKSTQAMSSNVDMSRVVFRAFSSVIEMAATVASGIHMVAAGFVELGSYAAQAMGMLNGWDAQEKQFWADFREETVRGSAATANFVLDLREANRQALAGWDATTTASRAAGAAAVEAYGETGKAAGEAAKKIIDANKAIEDTKQKINELREANESNNADIKRKMAEAYIEQGKKVADLEAKIAEEQERQEAAREERKKAKKKGTLTESLSASSDTLQALLQQYEVEEVAYNRMRKLQTALDVEVKEAKRRSDLTEFERQMEDFAAQMVRDSAAYQKKLATLQQELSDNEMKRAALGAIEQGITNTVKSELGKREAAVRSSVDTQIKEYNRLSSAAAKASSVKLATMGLPTFSTKSVNDAIITPQGQVIETHPDDYIIATKTPGAMGGATTVTVNINNPTVRNDGDLATMKRMIDDAMRGLMRDHKLATI